MNTFAQTLAQDYAVVWHNPDREYYVEGSGFLRLGGGRWLAVVPVVPRAHWSAERRAKHSRTHILRSDDGGKAWKKVSELPYYSGVPWEHGGAVYLFANKGGTEFRNDDLLLLRSEDKGATWSEPVLLFEGHFWNCQTAMARRDGKLYWALDDLSFGQRRGPRVVAGDLSGDPLDPGAWRLSNAVPFPGLPQSLVHPKFGAPAGMYLEPNVLNVRGQLRVLAAVKPNRQSTTGLCAVLDVRDEGGAVGLEFAQYHPMPGGHLKFCIAWDEASRLFWAVVNLAADGQGAFGWEGGGDAFDRERGRTFAGGNDRRFLMLMYGVDGLNWFPAGCVARAGKLSQSFMYGTLAIDGEDMGVISRTSVNAPNRHDADCATFHRVRNFRALAMDLAPEPENPGR